MPASCIIQTLYIGRRDTVWSSVILNRPASLNFLLFSAGRLPVSAHLPLQCPTYIPIKSIIQISFMRFSWTLSTHCNLYYLSFQSLKYFPQSPEWKKIRKNQKAIITIQVNIMVVWIRELVVDIKRIDSFVKRFRDRIYIDCM